MSMCSIDKLEDKRFGEHSTLSGAAMFPKKYNEYLYKKLLPGLGLEAINKEEAEKIFLVIRDANGTDGKISLSQLIEDISVMLPKDHPPVPLVTEYTIEVNLGENSSIETYKFSEPTSIESMYKSLKRVEDLK